METETEKLFNAPWKVNSTFPKFVIDKDSYFLAETDSERLTAILARLPELYDSLLDAVNDACGACAMMHIQDGYDFVTNGCPFEENEDCKCLKWISVLRKVRNAE